MRTVPADDPQPADAGPVADGLIDRRRLLRGGLFGAGAVLLAGCSSASGARGSSTSGPSTGGTATSTTSVPTTARTLARPGSRPRPDLPAGTDLEPRIEHIVVVMMENHSFDNVLGMLGRGDGFTRGADGLPTATNPDGHGNLVRAFHMPTECQTDGIGNDWRVAHEAYDHGTNQGFVRSTTAEAMGYLTAADLPFTNAMAATFPIADRWFCSALAQTDPNRRYLISGTSLGLVNDSFPTKLPPGGVIFDRLDEHGITWRDYYSNLPTLGVYLPLVFKPRYKSRLASIDRYFTDAAQGTLPGFSLVEPNYSTQSEENPQDVQFGDQFLAKVVHTAMSGPKWGSTMLIWCYDEHGGYYDHVPPPPAVRPDDVAPVLGPGDPPGAFDRYGFRVPAGVVSPYSRRGHVEHTVFDHTSILKTVEEKWNLPALTRRDANAAGLWPMLDFAGTPAFARPPGLPPPADPTPRAGCLTTGAGVIPPPSAVVPA